jgi:hypothetical protein
VKAILEQIVPTLRELGFKGSGQDYRKESCEAVMVVNFQRSSGGERFYVNLGGQPQFVPTEAEGQADPQRIKAYECIFRRRLNPPDGLPGWPYDLNISLVDDLKAKLSSAYKEYLYPLAQVPGTITELTPEAFKMQGPHSILGGTDSLNALNFARIASVRGDVKRAKSFAELGLAECPPTASGLRAKLKKLLQTIESDVAP